MAEKTDMMASALPDLFALFLVFPELFLATSAMALLIAGAFAGHRALYHIEWLAVLAILAAGSFLVLATPSGSAFWGAFILDDFARLLKILVLAGTGVTLIIARGYMRAEGGARVEFPVLVLSAAIGMMLMLSAGDLVALYMGLELQSLSLYVLAAIQRDNLRASEAGVKYFVLGALSSGLLLYGMSFVYGLTGTTGFAQINTALNEGTGGLALVIGIVFVLAGMAFKLSAVPFHMWTPDVYEGAPTPVTAFLAATSKIAAIGMIARIVFTAFEPAGQIWQQIVIFMAIASMLLGSLAALVQSDIKRLMAYSSIAHIGYLLAGLAAGTEIGLRGVIIYLFAYLFMTLGVFSCILSMRRKTGMTTNIDDLAGLWRSRPLMALMLAILMWSLAGIPPFFGFFAKWYVFLPVVEAGLYGLVLVGVLSFVIGAYYYLRIIKIMFFDEPAAPFLASSPELRLVIAVAGAVTTLFIFFPQPVYILADAAALSLFVR